jgi:hypothetical protein
MLIAFGGDVLIVAAHMGLRKGATRRADTVTVSAGSALAGQEGPTESRYRLEQLLGVLHVGAPIGVPVGHADARAKGTCSTCQGGSMHGVRVRAGRAARRCVEVQHACSHCS